MLKIFKYDFRALCKKFAVLYGVLLVLALVFSIYARIRNGSPQEDPIVIVVLESTLLFGISVLFTAIGIVTVVLPLSRYCKQLFSGEGYLTNTLPVHPWEQIAGRWLVAMVFVVLSVIATCCAAIVLAIPFYFVPNGYQVGDFFVTGYHLLSDLFAETHTTPFPLFLLLTCLTSLVSTACFLLLCYACLTLAYSVGRFKAVITAASLIVLHYIQSWVAELVVPGNSATDVLLEGDIVTFVSDAQSISRALVNIAVTVVFGALYFLATERMLRKHLNLK